MSNPRWGGGKYYGRCVFMCNVLLWEGRDSLPLRAGISARHWRHLKLIMSAAAAATTTLIKWRRDVNKALWETDRVWPVVSGHRWPLSGHTCWSSRSDKCYRLRLASHWDGGRPAGPVYQCPLPLTAVPSSVITPSARTPSRVSGALLRRDLSVTAFMWAWLHAVLTLAVLIVISLMSCDIM